MNIILIVLIVLAIFVAFAVLNVAASILWLLLTGLVVGALARLAMPGDQSIGLLGTSLAGAAGSFIAGMVGDAASLAWVWSFLLSILFAGIAIALVAGSASGSDLTARD